MLDRRSFAVRALAGLGALLSGAVTRSRPAAAAEKAGQIWMCTFEDCEPYYYDPALGDPVNFTGDEPIPPGTDFLDLPRSWRCPVCGARKNFFVRVDSKPAR